MTAPVLKSTVPVKVAPVVATPMLMSALAASVVDNATVAVQLNAPVGFANDMKACEVPAQAEMVPVGGRVTVHVPLSVPV